MVLILVEVYYKCMSMHLSASRAMPIYGSHSFSVRWQGYTVCTEILKFRVLAIQIAGACQQAKRSFLGVLERPMIDSINKPSSHKYIVVE